MRDAAACLEEAAAAVAAGGVVAIPTDTVYGLGVDAGLEGATARLFALKGRPDTVALPVLVAEPAVARDLATLDLSARRLIERFWPGPLTLVLRRAAGVRLDLGGDPATIGLRCPGNDVARRLLARTGPLAVSSANRHGEAPATTAAAVRAGFGPAVAAVLDGGRCEGAASTVISLAGDGWALLRAGSITAGDLEAVLGVPPHPVEQDQAG